MSTNTVVNVYAKNWVPGQGVVRDYVATVADLVNAELLIGRMRAAGHANGKDFDYDEVAVVSGDIQPLVERYVEVRISDAGETFLVVDEKQIVWPFDGDPNNLAIYPDSEWKWLRSPHYFGILFVRGFDHEAVETTLQTYKKALIEDPKFRDAREHLGNWNFERRTGRE